jgi:GntR family transcriptional regulator
LTIFIRIEPSSSVPIYRQIIDQIKYQVVTGRLTEGDKVPSVRELAGRLAVNQNTILKVYNELCRQNVLKIERGDGTYVSSSKQSISAAERKKAVASVLREAATLAVQLELPIEQAGELLRKEYENIVSQRAGRGKAGPSEK